MAEEEQQPNERWTIGRYLSENYPNTYRTLNVMDKGFTIVVKASVTLTTVAMGYCILRHPELLSDAGFRANLSVLSIFWMLQRTNRLM